MTPKRFIARNYADAMRLAKEAFGDNTIIMKTNRLADGNTEVIAMSGEGVPEYHQPAPIRQPVEEKASEDFDLSKLKPSQLEKLLSLVGVRKENPQQQPQESVETANRFDQAMEQKAAPYRRGKSRPNYDAFNDDGAVFRSSSPVNPAAMKQVEEPINRVDEGLSHLHEQSLSLQKGPSHNQGESVVDVVELRPLLNTVQPAQSSVEKNTPSSQFEQDLASGSALVKQSKSMLEDIEALQGDIRRQILPRMTEGRTYAHLYERLHSIGLKREVCHQIINSLPADILLGQVSEEEAMSYLEQAIAQHLPVMKTPELWGNGHKIITLVGSTGIGKSTSLAKLAHRYALSEGENNVIIMTLDPDHQEPLKSHCDALGIKFAVIPEYEDLGQAIGKVKDKYRLILLDTPGYGHRNEKLDTHFERLASCGHDIQPVLVLNANSDIESLQTMASTYRVVAEAHNMDVSWAIISKLDEAVRVGGVLNTVAHLNLNICYQSSGNDILDGFEKANTIGLIKEALEQSRGIEDIEGLFAMDDQGVRFESNRQEILKNITRMHNALRVIRQELSSKNTPVLMGSSVKTGSD